MGLRAYLVRNTEFLAIEAAFYKYHNRIRCPAACGSLNRSLGGNWGERIGRQRNFGER